MEEVRERERGGVVVWYSARLKKNYKKKGGGGGAGFLSGIAIIDSRLGA